MEPRKVRLSHIAFDDFTALVHAPTDAKEMLAYKHSGLSVDASVCIEAHDQAGLERLLRYCARPPFSMERLRKQGGDLVYRCAKQHSEPVGGKVADIIE